MTTYKIWHVVVLTGKSSLKKIEEWGIYRLGGVDFDTLTEFDIQTLDLFIKSENGYIREEV